MTTLKKFNLNGEEVGEIQIADHLVDVEVSGQMVKDYIVALRANARQWSANTKGRSEVNHTTKKPHPQKGGGRARQGSLAAPQYKGGGRVFGPKPKFDQHVKINVREKRAAIRFLLSEKIRENRIRIVENFQLDQPRTKQVAGFLKSQSMNGRVLFLGEGSYANVMIGDESQKVSVQDKKHENFVRSARNIPGVSFSLATNISGYDVLVARELVITEAALQEINEWLS
ncbi:50S ribosomal protein L4 [Candidatus Rubidus massiliensis]|nr:MAG: 50S ribosomal protein L4 [Chlamydia sp. 32-24]CDZ80463.1 50S ribosomal protein L4 [Candidatus Rubidus massiliensis]